MSVMLPSSNRLPLARPLAPSQGLSTNASAAYSNSRDLHAKTTTFYREPPKIVDNRRLCSTGHQFITGRPRTLSDALLIIITVHFINKLDICIIVIILISVSAVVLLLRLTFHYLVNFVSVQLK